MIRPLIYTNISNAKGGITRDSGFHVARNVINYILRKRDDFFFYLTIPVGSESVAKSWLERPDRVQLIPLRYSSAGSLNKMHMDIVGLRKNLPWILYPITVIWNNEAYMSLLMLQALKATLPYAKTSLANYVHWIEIPRQNRLGSIHKGNWHMWALASGIYWNSKTYFNSQYGIELVKPYFRKFCRGDIYEEIESKMEPLYLGINVEELDKFKTNEVFDRPTFIFNQRIVPYTGARSVLQAAIDLIKDGYKFYIILTNPSQSTIKTIDYNNPDYKDCLIRCEGLPYPKYVETLWKSDAVIAWHGGYKSSSLTSQVGDAPVSQWSIAFPEAIACECYPIAHNLGFFSEMLPKDYLIPTKSLENLKTSMRLVIENVEYYRKKSSQISSYVREKYDWKVRIDDWIKAFEQLHDQSFRSYGTISASTIERIEKVIRTQGHFKWSDLSKQVGWMSQMKLSRMAPYFWLCANYKETPTAEPVFSSQKLMEWI